MKSYFSLITNGRTVLKSSSNERSWTDDHMLIGMRIANRRENRQVLRNNRKCLFMPPG